MGNTTCVAVEMIKEKLSYDGSVEAYNNVVKNLTDAEKKELGEFYELWRLGCEYKFLMSGTIDPSPSVAAVISTFKQRDAEILYKPPIEATREHLTLSCATKLPKYETQTTEPELMIHIEEP
jgi:hypothetical protein